MTVTQTDLRQAPAPVASDERRSRNARRSTAGILVAAAAACFFLVYPFVVPTSSLLVGFFVIFLMISLMLLKIPIAIAMTVASFPGLYLLAGQRALEGSLQEIAFSSFASWSLSVIPMFVLMGIVLGKSGLMSGAYDMARKWLGWMPGGLAVSTNIAGAGMAATSGSSIGNAYAIGRVAIPELIKSGYRPSLTLGSVAMAGTLGQVIPPSVLLVIYAGVAETPVGPQLLAGVVPGIALAVLFTVVILAWAMISPDAAPRGASYPLRERLASLVNLIPMLIIVSVVIGGIYVGVFTATEAGACGAAVTVVLGLAALIVKARRARANGEPVKTHRVLAKFLSTSLIEATSAVAAVFLLLIGVNLLTRVMTLSGLAEWVADGVVGMNLTRLTFLLILIPVYLVLGFFLDTLGMMLLTIPVFIGPLVALDVNLIWFGVFLIVLAEIDLVAPPLGVLNFVVLALGQASTKGMGVKLTIGDVFKGVTPFIGACVVFLVALIVWPELATWLPDVSSAK
ncbi:TRAP transporter large permease [Nocardioides sp. NPDC051685]|uniref:TRAP transporter large permease n=1 Tax=Nocardioides sp. NPDC051685 TaxID=3364334 RepID=UPI0037B8424A